MRVKDVATGKLVEVEIFRLAEKEFSKILRKDNWKFDWKKEKNNHIYKLVFKDNGDNVFGLVSVSVGEGGGFLYINLIESSANNVGKDKQYDFVAGILFAFVCKLSFNQGYEGYVAFRPKTKLYNHYKSVYGAKDAGINLHFDTVAAYNLIEKYLH